MTVSPTTLALRFTEGPAGPPWDLPADCHSGVVGWVLDRLPVDAGVPGGVAAILAGTLCGAGRVTFLSSTHAAVDGTSWARVPDGDARVVRPSASGRVLGKIPFPLLCTSDPSVAAELFKDPAFPWGQGGQLAILSSASAPLPELDHAAIRGAFDADMAPHTLRNAAWGVMLPGPDGDFARFLSWDEASWSRLVAGLSNASARSGIPFVVVGESEFNSTRWCREEP